MNPFKGSRVFLIVALVPIMLPQVLPEPLRWIWLTLVVIVILRRLGIISIGINISEGDTGTSAFSKPSASSQNDAKNQGEIVALGSAPYQFDEANCLSYYITLRSLCGAERTVWGVDLKRVAHETPLSIGDTVALEFLGREAVIVKQPVKDNHGRVISHRKVNTYRHTWAAHVLSS